MKASDETRALAKLKRLRPLRRFLRRGTFFDLRRSKRFITATLRYYGVVCSYRTLGRAADYRSVTPYLAAYAKLRRSSWNNLVCPDLAVLNICACRWRRGCQGGQATVVVSHAKPTNWLRVHLGDSDCNGSRTVLVYRCRGGASRYVSRVNHTHAAQHTAQCNGLCDEHQHPRYYGNTTAGCIPHWCGERRYRRFCRNCFWRSDSLRDKRLSIRSQQAVAISVAFSKKKPFFLLF